MSEIKHIADDIKQKATVLRAEVARVKSEQEKAQATVLACQGKIAALEALASASEGLSQLYAAPAPTGSGVTR